MLEQLTLEETHAGSFNVNVKSQNSVEIDDDLYNNKVMLNTIYLYFLLMFVFEVLN